VTSWGWPTTSGLPTVDYFISQKGLEPENAQEQYTEKLIELEHLPVYYYHPPVPTKKKPLSYYGLPENKPLYICQQNLRKVHPDFDEIIHSILEKDQNGIVIFVKDKHEGITKKLQNRISIKLKHNYDRVVFLERMSEEDYLGLLAQCSIVLDTIHYGGGANTIYDAIETKIPIITLEGTKHSGRFGANTMRKIDCLECIATTSTDYIEKAVTISNTTALRNSIQKKYSEHSNLLFENISSVRELESFYLSINK
jgi:predicted O-linked N-acetylglucosamine transferase (SPINDLY family)